MRWYLAVLKVCYDCDSSHTPCKNTQTWLNKRRDLCTPIVNFVSCIGVVHKYPPAHHHSLKSRGSKSRKFLLILLFACIACQSLEAQSIFCMLSSCQSVKNIYNYNVGINIILILQISFKNEQQSAKMQIF